MFEQKKLGGRLVKNSVVVPPMVCFFDDVFDGFVSEKCVEHYEKLARGGAGTIIVEATCIDDSARLSLSQIGIWDDKFIDGLSRIASAIKECDALALIQIHHAGLRTPKKVCAVAASPSDYADNYTSGREMTVSEILSVQEKFVKAARRALKAGFDGVEIHGCHAYLLSDFMSDTVNKRTDIYGTDKAKFAVDVLNDVRIEIGTDKILGIRMSGNDPSMADSVKYALQFSGASADYLHVSTGFLNTIPKDFSIDETLPLNFIAQMAFEIKKHVDVPVICVNGIRTPEHAEIALKYADFVAVGKGHLVDYNWTNKAKSGGFIDLCLSCAKCKCFGGVSLCVKKTGS